VEACEGSRPGPVADAAPPGDGSLSGSEPGAGAVAAALASLGHEHRQVIVCTFYEHLSADDVAARLGIPVRDVKRRACSALNEIRRILEERGVPVPRQPAALPVPRQPAA
jgi:DNA-directed RNA polymerase specialized sigma24 family protein